MTEPEKYAHILGLSKSQVAALQRNDLALFNDILATKSKLIRSLENSRALLIANPELMAVAYEIHETEKKSAQILANRIESVGEKLQLVRQTGKARLAYASNNKSLPRYVPTRDTPKLFDLRY